MKNDFPQPMTIHDGRGASRMYDGETENSVFYLMVAFLKVPHALCSWAYLTIKSNLPSVLHPALPSEAFELRLIFHLRHIVASLRCDAM